MLQSLHRRSAPPTTQTAHPPSSIFTASQSCLNPNPLTQNNWQTATYSSQCTVTPPTNLATSSIR